MATKKDLEKTEATETKAEKKKTVTIKLPRAARGQDNFQFVGVNGKAYKVKRGEDVEVPVEVAEVLRNSEKMLAEGDAFIEGVAH